MQSHRTHPGTLPWFAVSSAVLVLAAALVMSAPGEYELARLAGWSPRVAWLMPVCLSVYAGVAAFLTALRPGRTAGRVSAVAGAGMALTLAMMAQVVAHLIATEHLAPGPWLVVAASSVPSIVVGHILHLVVSAWPRRTVEPVEDGEQRTGSGGWHDSAEVETPRVGAETEEEPPVLVSVREAAMRTGALPSTIRTWLGRERLVKYKPDGRRVLVDLDAVRELMAGHDDMPGEPAAFQDLAAE